MNNGTILKRKKHLLNKAVYNAVAMECQVFVEQHANNGYVAEIIGLPNCQAVGKTEEEAISKVKEALMERLTRGKIVTINVETQITSEDHSVWKGFGRIKNDPTFDDLMERIAEYRRELDGEEVSSALVESSRRIANKYKEAFAEMKRLGD